MTYPTVDVNTTNLDATTDSPASARADLLDLATKFNGLRPLPADLAASGGSAIVGFIQSGSGAVLRTLQSKVRDTVSALDFMSDAQRADVIAGTASIDVTAAIQAAIDSITVGEIIFPKGGYKVVAGFSMGERKSLRGEGQAATKFYFTPTADNTACITVIKGASVCNQNNISGFSIIGGGTKIKVGIRADDTSMLNIDDVAMSYMANESIGILLRGREFTTISRVELGYVDYPIRIEPNVNGGSVDCDHLHIRDSYLLSTPGHYHITIAEDVALTNLLIDGTNAWVNGDGGIYWNDTVGASGALNLSINNVRLEGQTDNTKYLFYFNRTGANIYNVSFQNIYGGSVAKGFYLRSMVDVALRDVFYINGSGAEGINANSSVYRMEWSKVYWQSGVTATLTDQRLMFGIPSIANSSLSGSAFYESSAGAGAGTGALTSVLLAGDMTPGRTLRQSDIKIEPGTTASTLKVTVLSVWNGDAISVTDNIGKGATTGDFSLNAGGTVLTVLDSGIAGSIVGVLNTEFRNFSGVALYSPQAYKNGTGIDFNVKSDTSGTNKDLTTLTSQIWVGVTYISGV